MHFMYAQLYLNTQQIECINSLNDIPDYALQMHYEIIFITDLLINTFLLFYFIFIYIYFVVNYQTEEDQNNGMKYNLSCSL